MASCDHIHLPRHVPNWHLVRWFLDLDFLVAHELTLLYLQDQLAFDLVLLAAHAGALDLWSELFLSDDLVDFHAASVASINSHLHAWFHIAAPGDDTLHADKGADRIRLDVTHSLEVLLHLSVFAAWLDDQAVLSLELWRNEILSHAQSF